MLPALLATLMPFALVGRVLASSDIFSLPSKSNHSEELLEDYGKFMLSVMNRSIDPCENFYEYSCGGWKKSELVPELARNSSFLYAIQQRIDESVLGFLQNVTQKELEDLGTNGTRSSELKAKQFFASCVKVKANMSLGYDHLEQDIDDRNKEQQPAKTHTLDWIYVNFMSKYEIYPLLPMKVHYSTSSRKFDVLLSPPTKVLAGVNDEQLKNMTRDFGWADNLEKTKQFLESFVNLTIFEKNLTALAKTRNETEKLSLKDFLGKHKQDRLNWTRYFEMAFNGTQDSSWPVLNQLDAGSTNDLVYFLEQTPLDTLKSYVRMRVLLKFHALWKTKTKEGGVQSECRSLTETYFNYAVLPWFIGKVFDKNQRADILTVAKDIRDTFYELLDHHAWLDDDTRSQAKTKLASMDILVGYTDDLQHREVIDQVYSEINMTGNWYENLCIIEGSRASIRLRSVDKALIPILMPTRTVNAYYADFLNLAFITIGMAQWPFYHRDFPAVLKYAGVGNIIGHEMAHGFDSYCYQYNYDGKRVNWWSATSLRNFKERYRCLESQYNKFILMGVQTNGTMTSGDNIADNVGTRMAYYAYKRKTGDKAWLERPLRGLDFNNKQLFFVKFAQSWCNGKDSGDKLKKLKTDVHAYDEFRVQGTLSNMPEFSEAFGCKLGSEMNPLKKCVVW
ncbi:endothelin-converting enzyme homolog [Drosophila guanche]|uniref:Blast:Endothelin-converting enzyme 2 n=1 Tax=Drosophila guanche TaxID=7266 RepID=A0A3B0JZ34_DROGU|nr:endothelin-converting enzyme homolog [Drosophila guanche]SPP78939.1 blast:Endothelin-converting enzyme 2 [Drosophila guanche]